MKYLIASLLGVGLLTAVVPPRPASAQDTTFAGPNRGGFTLFLAMGVGIQKDDAFDDAAVGIGGLNLGLGGFLSEDLALMFRVSGTTADQTLGDGDQGFDVTQTSGVMGIAAQYWVSDRFNIEGGPGLGIWTTDVSDDQGFGIIAGAGYSVFQSRKVNLQLGVEYAVALTTIAVHNVGFNFGFQLL